MLSLFTVFHLNLAYSSIEEEQRPQVVRDCYWPLLRLARKFNLPFGIEASAYTLLSIADIDPAWIAELRSLTTEGPCEFVGSGYAQLIGPLVPAEVNTANLRLGNEAYSSLLGHRPAIALVNEQAYSAGLLRHYIDAGYQAIIMEWDNPARRHPEWKAEWRYFPQVACGQHGEKLPLIWNKSIAFQKFQRYAHGETDLMEYLDYISKHVADIPRAFPLYGNDIEIFDFRPGRYHTEPSRQNENEWLRIERLIEALLADSRLRFIRPTQVLELMGAPSAGQHLRLETPQDPVPVKKQEKYNLNRWAVTGRDDLAINTACWGIYETLRNRSGVDRDGDDQRWRELCCLWGSDFRTHITERRWLNYRKCLAASEQIAGADGTNRFAKNIAGITKSQLSSAIKLDKGNHYLTIETSNIKVVLNQRRGLAIDQLYFRDVAEDSLVGTLHHGYYDDIALGADFYTGHMVLESPARPKVTDLNPVEPEICWNEELERVEVQGVVATQLGLIRKTVFLERVGALGIRYELEWDMLPVGALRLGHVTLNPDAFLADQLYFETHNGGEREHYRIDGNRIEHGRSVSFLVSSSTALGMTNGEIKVGDNKKSLTIEVEKNIAAFVGQITYIPTINSYFFRVSLSGAELDDTTRERAPGEFLRNYEFRIRARSE